MKSLPQVTAIIVVMLFLLNTCGIAFALSLQKIPLNPVRDASQSITNTQVSIKNDLPPAEGLPREAVPTEDGLTSLLMGISPQYIAQEKESPAKSAPMTPREKVFLRNLFSFLYKETTVHTQESLTQIPQQSKTLEKRHWTSFFSRKNYVLKKCGTFMKWFRKKDEKKDNELREEWETWLGVDIFHPYYKYKEAQDILKEKFTFETPRMLPRMKVRPEYKNKQFKVTFIKKF